MVDYSILFQKLTWYGVGGEELKWFEAREKGQRVCVGGAKSEWDDIRRGVLQGSILGPLLFILLLMTSLRGHRSWSMWR